MPDVSPSSPPRRVAIFVHAEPLAQALTQELGDLGYLAVRPPGTVTVDELAAGGFALLVVDVDLCNGRHVVALVAGLVARGDDPPVVFLTSGPAPALTELPEAGVYGLVTKPDLAAALATTVGLLTRQHAARLRLRALERRHLELFDHAALGVGELDLTTGHLVEVNRRGAAILAADDVALAEPFIERFAPEHRADLAAALAAADAGPVTLTVRRAVAPEVDVRLTLSPLDARDPRRVVVILDDVTAARRVERRLRRQQRMLAESQRISHVGSYAMVVRTGELTWSDQMSLLHGFEPDGFTPSLELLWPRIHPDDRPRLHAAQAAALAGVRPPAGEAVPLAYRLVMPGGVVRYVHGRGELMVDDDGEQVMIGTVRDVTREHLTAAALRQSEARYRSVFEFAVGGIVLTDLAGVIIDVNPAAVSIVGC